MEPNQGKRQESRRWHIVLAMWTIIFLECGLMKCFGVLLPALLDQFASYTRTIGVTVSMTLFFGNVLSLTAQPLTRILEGRTIIMTCAVITTAGLILNSLAGHVPLLLLGMICVGFSSMESTLGLGMMSSYFTKYYSSNIFIAMTATPLAVMVFAPMTQLFLDIYGWRGALLLIAGVNLHCVVAAAVLKPVKQVQYTSSNGSTNECVLRHVKKNQNTSNYEFTHDCLETVQTENKTCFQEILNASLFMNRSYVILLFIYTVYGFASNGWIVYLVTILQSKGLSPYESTVVATTSGIGCFVIRVLLAIIPRNERRDRQVLYFGSMLIPLTYAAFYFATSYLALSILGFLLGVGVGNIGTQVYIVGKYCIEKDNAVSAIAWFNILQGVGYMASGYITGWLYDLTSSFQHSLICLSGVSSMMAVALVLEDIWKIYKANRR